MKLYTPLRNEMDIWNRHELHVCYRNDFVTEQFGYAMRGVDRM